MMVMVAQQSMYVMPLTKLHLKKWWTLCCTYFTIIQKVIECFLASLLDIDCVHLRLMSHSLYRLSKAVALWHSSLIVGCFLVKRHSCLLACYQIASRCFLLLCLQLLLSSFNELLLIWCPGNRDKPTFSVVWSFVVPLPGATTLV